MIFLCGLFFPIASLPVFLRPLSYLLPLTYGADILHGAIYGRNMLPLAMDFLLITVFGIVLFSISMRNIHKKWIV
jgi:ABC-2 type transport system permease protein